MTNKEKFREKLEDYALAGAVWTLNEKGEPVLFTRDTKKFLETTERIAWLNQEYKEPVPEVDWSTVAIGLLLQ